MKFPDLKKAAVALWRAAKYFAKHRSLTVSPSEKARRLKICDSCPYLHRWGRLHQCRVCTCLVHAKAALVTEDCPKNLWTL